MNSALQDKSNTEIMTHQHIYILGCYEEEADNSTQQQNAGGSA